MKHLNQTQAIPAQSPGLKIIAVSAVAIATAFTAAPAAMAQAHNPLNPATQTSTSAPTTVDLLGDPKGSAIAAAIEARIMAGKIDQTFPDTLSPSVKEAARLAYAQGLFQPIWSRDAADALFEANSDFQSETDHSVYSDDDLRAAIANRFDGSDAEQAMGDLTLTSAWLTLASKKSGGLSDEGGMVKSTEARPTRSDLVQALRRAGQADPVEAMQPFVSRAPQYVELEKALKQYRKFAENGGWMRLHDGDDMLEPGMSDPRVPALRKRLAAEGYVPTSPFQPVFAALNNAESDTSGTYYDDVLVEQVKTFQAAHGLMQDGILGPATLAALNESVDSKIDRIETAMDYWRENANPGDRYIWVNIPSYRAEAWTGDRRDIAMDTIVGKKRTPTTAFSDEIEYIVVNPKWFLPIGLFKRQKLRKLRKDPGYAAANNYIVYDRSSGARLDPYAVDWTERGVSRRIRMVQTPGPHNALGQLKIIFPNKHAIYLHDTPARDLFKRDVRALSSGCIRLLDPVKMANWLTDGDDKVDTEVFNATLASRDRERFYLDKHVNVHLTYLPAVVSPEGQFEFPADIYREFKKPTLAEGVYPDNIQSDDDGEPYAGINDTETEEMGVNTEDQR